MGSLDREETKQERMERRDSAIQKRYEELRSEKFQERRLFTHESIIAKIAYEFYLSRNHISAIINGNTHYQRRQTSLDFDDDNTQK